MDGSEAPLNPFLSTILSSPTRNLTVGNDNTIYPSIYLANQHTPLENEETNSIPTFGPHVESQDGHVAQHGHILD